MSSQRSARAFRRILGIYFIIQFDTRLRLRLYRPLWFQQIRFIFLSFLFLFLADVFLISLRTVCQEIQFPELLDFSSRQVFYLGQIRESPISRALVNPQGPLPPSPAG